VNSVTKVDFTRLPCGTPLDLKLHPSTVAGEAGVDALIALLRSFVARGGFYLQLDVTDAATLRDAQDHPERYPNLSVRVSGWSARFTTLSREWQEMIINRTEQHFAGR
jgi:formate C-acetyltransferase